VRRDTPQSGNAAVATDVLAVGADLGQVFDRLLRRHANLSLAQYRVLATLADRRPEPCEPWQLAEALRMSSPHVSAVLDQLTGRGLVVRAGHPDDGRRRLVELTDGGAERLEMFAPFLAAVESRVVAATLTPDEQATLRSLLGRLHRALDGLAIPEGRPRPGP